MSGAALTLRIEAACGAVGAPLAPLWYLTLRIRARRPCFRPPTCGMQVELVGVVRVASMEVFVICQNMSSTR